MTREEAKQLLPIIAAWAEGRTIQINDNGHWDNVRLDDLGFTFPPRDYRIKPEPREFWVNLYKHGSHAIHMSKREADEWKQRGLIETIRVREVLE